MPKAEKKAKDEDPTKKKLAVKKTGKDPDKPNRSKSAYMYFCDAMRAGVKEQNPGLKLPQITTKLSELWKNASDTEKAVR